MRSRFGRFIDNLFISLVAFTATFVVLREIFLPKLSFTLSIIVAIITFRFIIYYQNRRYHKLNLKADEQKLIELNNFELRKLPINLRYDFFKKLLASDIVSESENGLMLKNGLLLVIEVDEPSLSPQKLFNINFHAEQMPLVKEVVIVLNSVSAEAEVFSKKLGIPYTFFTPLETYALMKKHNFFIKKQLQKTQKSRLSSVKSQLFLKKQSKNFLRIGFLLFIASIFVPFVKTYIITASVCLVLAIICALFGQSKNEISSLGKELLQ